MQTLIYFSLKNVIRRPRYYLAIGLGIIIFVSSFMVMFGTLNNINSILLKKELQHISCDYLGNSSYPDYQAVRDALYNVKNTRLVLLAYKERLFNVIVGKGPPNQTEIENYHYFSVDLRLVGFDNITLSKIQGWKIIEGQPNVDDGIVIDRSLANLYDLHAGDNITLSHVYYLSINGSILEKVITVSIPIAAIISVSGTLQDFINDLFEGQGGFTIFLNYSTAKNLYTEMYLDIYGPFRPDYVFRTLYLIFTDREKIIDEWNIDKSITNAKNLELQYELATTIFGLEITAYLVDMLERIHTRFLDLRNTLIFISFPILLLSFIMIIAAGYTSFKERLQEFGLLKIRGASINQIKKLVFYDIILIVPLSVTIAIIIGSSLSHFVFEQSVRNLLIQQSVSYRPFTAFEIGIFVILGIISSIGSITFPLRNISKISPLLVVSEFETKEKTEIKINWHEQIMFIISVLKITEWVVGFNPMLLLNKPIENFLFAILIQLFVFVDLAILQYIAPIIILYVFAKVIASHFDQIADVILKIKYIPQHIKLISKNITYYSKEYSKLVFSISVIFMFIFTTSIYSETLALHQYQTAKVYVGSDINFQFTPQNLSVNSILSQFDAIQSYTFVYRYVSYGYRGFIALYGIDSKSYYNTTKDCFYDNFLEGISPKDAFQKLSEMPNSVLVMKDFAEKYEYKIGDNFTLTWITKEHRVFTISFHIIGFISQIVGAREYGLFDFSSLYQGKKFAMVTDIKWLVSRRLNLGEAYNAFLLVDTKEGTNTTELASEILNEIPSLRDYKVLTQMINEIQLDPYSIAMSTMLTMFNIIALIIASYFLYMTTIFVLTDRKKFFEILFTRGMSRKQLLEITLFEGLIVVFIGEIIGIITSIFFSLGLIVLKNSENVLSFKYQLVVPSIVIFYIILGLALFTLILIINIKRTLPTGRFRF
ncbi:MAG: ABC transporter permease [Candidatus Asgardarchaeia archaeon]